MPQRDIRESRNTVQSPSYYNTNQIPVIRNCAIIVIQDNTLCESVQETKTKNKTQKMLNSGSQNLEAVVQRCSTEAVGRVSVNMNHRTKTMDLQHSVLEIRKNTNEENTFCCNPWGRRISS